MSVLDPCHERNQPRQPLAADPGRAAVCGGRAGVDGVKPAVSVDLIALQPAATLLAPHDARLERLRQQASCSAVQFEAVYAPLLERFAEYVQRVPCAAQPECTILESRLAAAERSLARRRGAILPRNAGPEHVAREADLWTYVLFSAALLRCLAAEFAPCPPRPPPKTKLHRPRRVRRRRRKGSRRHPWRRGRARSNSSWRGVRLREGRRLSSSSPRNWKGRFWPPVDGACQASDLLSSIGSNSSAATPHITVSPAKRTSSFSGAPGRLRTL